MNNWYMLTLVGNDRTGIVAKVTRILQQNNCQLGEASMLRLGGNFTIMMMVNSELSSDDIITALQAISAELNLQVHLDEIEGRLHEHHIPNVLVTVIGADRGGIIAQVTEKLFNVGFDILNLDSDVAGTDERAIYIMRIEGQALDGIESIEAALQPLKADGIDISVQAIETLIA